MKKVKSMITCINERTGETQHFSTPMEAVEKLFPMVKDPKEKELLCNDIMEQCKNNSEELINNIPDDMEGILKGAIVSIVKDILQVDQEDQQDPNNKPLDIQIKENEQKLMDAEKEHIEDLQELHSYVFEGNKPKDKEELNRSFELLEEIKDICNYIDYHLELLEFKKFLSEGVGKKGDNLYIAKLTYKEQQDLLLNLFTDYKKNMNRFITLCNKCK